MIRSFDVKTLVRLLQDGVIHQGISYYLRVMELVFKCCFYDVVVRSVCTCIITSLINFH